MTVSAQSILGVASDSRQSERPRASPGYADGRSARLCRVTVQGRYRTPNATPQRAHVCCHQRPHERLFAYKTDRCRNAGHAAFLSVGRKLPISGACSFRDTEAVLQHLEARHDVARDCQDDPVNCEGPTQNERPDYLLKIRLRISTNFK